MSPALPFYSNWSDLVRRGWYCPMLRDCEHSLEVSLGAHVSNFALAISPNWTSQVLHISIGCHDWFGRCFKVIGITCACSIQVVIEIEWNPFIFAGTSLTVPRTLKCNSYVYLYPIRGLFVVVGRACRVPLGNTIIRLNHLFRMQQGNMLLFIFIPCIYYLLRRGSLCLYLLPL
jgi:hypothetical protein